MLSDVVITHVLLSMSLSNLLNQVESTLNVELTSLVKQAH